MQRNYGSLLKKGYDDLNKILGMSPDIKKLQNLMGMTLDGHISRSELAIKVLSSLKEQPLFSSDRTVEELSAARITENQCK